MCFKENLIKNRFSLFLDKKKEGGGDVHRNTYFLFKEIHVLRGIVPMEGRTRGLYMEVVPTEKLGDTV